MFFDYITKMVFMKYLLLLAFFVINTSLNAQTETADQKIIRLTQEIKKDPNNATLYIYRNQAYIAKKNYNSALTDCNTAVRLDNKTIYGWSNRGYVYFLMGNYTFAASDFSNAIRINPQENFSRQYRAMAYHNQGYYNLALLDYIEAVKTEPNNAFILSNRGLAYFNLKRYDLALKDFNDAIRITPNDGFLYGSRGYTYHAMMKYDLALKDYNQSLALNPADDNIRQNKINLLLAQANYKDAIGDISLMLTKNPRNDSVLNLRGDAYFSVGDYDNADRDYKNAMSINPQNGDYVVSCIENYLAVDNISDAVALLKKYRLNKMKGYMDVKPEYTFLKTYFIACCDYLAKNDLKTALQLLLQSSEEFNKTNIGVSATYNSVNYAHVLAKTGWVYDQLNDKDNALKYYTKAQIISPSVQNVALKIKNLNNKIKEDIAVDNTAPEIKILTPKVTRGITVEADDSPDNKTFVSGIVKDISGVDWVKINGSDVTALKVDGYFSADIPNSLTSFTVQAADKKGNIATSRFTLEKPVVASNDIKGGANNNSITIPVIQASDQPSFHAVLIACSKYSGGKWPELPTTINEAKEFKKVLYTNYAFDSSNILELYDKGYVDILSGLSSKLQSLKETDNLIIFFAGHGTYRKAGNDLVGYWVPLNASNPDIDYISNKKLDELIVGTKVKHILMLSDACYSGAMRSENMETKTPTKYEYKLRSRQVLTGGGLEKVPGESVFIKMVMKALEINTDKYISASGLYSIIYSGVKAGADTEPRLFEFGKDGNEGGQFYFIKR